MHRVLDLIQRLSIAIETKDQLTPERLREMTERIWAGAEVLKREGNFSFPGNVTILAHPVYAQVSLQEEKDKWEADTDELLKAAL